jgi:hypothetical protein
VIPARIRHSGLSRRAAVEWGLGALGCLAALLVPLAVLALPQSEVVAVVAPPGADTTDGVRIVAEAGGTLLNRGSFDNVVLARSDRAGFAGRLYAAGARLVLDGRLAGGCRPSAPLPSSPNAAADTAWDLP